MSATSHLLPLRTKDFSAWYHTLVKKAGLIHEGPVRGTMILKPYGYALWERIQHILDGAFKSTGHQNVYFPLLIPLSHLSQEADHVEGFAKECAVVTHYRLQATDQGTIAPDPAAQLEEPLVVRPTSETIIWNTYRQWIQSYRDLPLLLNQWANVVRWEMRTRPFLRTTEILWQEGHTAHATAEEAQAEAHQMHDLYADFITQYLAIPVIQGEKTPHERFAGALNTYTLEALMQDGKALQLGTSHFLGQNFSKAFGVRFADEHGKLQYAWGTSWGLTTRLIGALIMTHSDDHGLVLPPKIAPTQVIIVPIFRKDTATRDAILAQADTWQVALQAQGIRTTIDPHHTQSPGWKFTQAELQGIPLRITLGPRDLTSDTVEVVRRDTRTTHTLPKASLVTKLPQLLDTIQADMLAQAQTFQQEHTTTVTTFQALQDALAQDIPGFVLAHWDGTTETEQKIQQATQATIRCIPFGTTSTQGTCIYTGQPSTQQVLFAKAY